jgi:hypothetical protein
MELNLEKNIKAIPALFSICLRVQNSIRSCYGIMGGKEDLNLISHIRGIHISLRLSLLSMADNVWQ